MSESPYNAPSEVAIAPNPNLGLAEPIRASYLSTGLRDSAYTTQSEANSTSFLPVAKQEAVEEAAPVSDPAVEQKRPSRRRWIIIAGVLAALAVLVLVIVLPVYFKVIKPRNDRSALAGSGGQGGSSGDGQPGGSGSGDSSGSSSGVLTGGDGSEVKMEDGSTFTYNNKFGGFWVTDPKNPFNNDARPNSWTPPLNTSWDFGKDRINGVNLGGLFVLEPFISPALFQKYPDAVDEWTISQLMAADTANGGLSQLEDHYNTFVTEQDIAEIAGAGLNWIRLPIPFWAIETWPGEPFLAKTSWKYILRLLGWARKYGLRVNIDLHTIPGSQNGYNHSGKLGVINFMHGVMGIANAQRTLEYLRVFTEFFSQDQYKGVVVMFGIMNEALLGTIGKTQMTSFYLEAHNMIRDITGLGAGKGPYISIHDGFQGLSSWADFLPGSDRIVLDSHPYFAFDGGNNDDPIDTSTNPDTAGGEWPAKACSRWASGMNSSRKNFGVTVAGEFSGATNDCGTFLKGTTIQSSAGNCDEWEDASKWDAATVAGVKQLIMAQMDAFGDYFFWTWKVGNTSTHNRVESPLWSYQLGLQGGWIPEDPRTAVGKCASIGETGMRFDGTFEPWQTGGAGAGTISGSSRWPWPPATIAGANAPATDLPVYTPTGLIVSLPAPTATGATPTVDLGDGWFNPQDTASAPAEISGCKYPDAWDAEDASIPGASCVTPAPTR